MSNDKFVASKSPQPPSMETPDVSIFPNIKLDLSHANQAPKPTNIIDLNPGSSQLKPQILATQFHHLKTEKIKTMLSKSLGYSVSSNPFLSQTPLLLFTISPFTCLLSSFFLHSFSPTPKSMGEIQVHSRGDSGKIRAKIEVPLEIPLTSFAVLDHHDPSKVLKFPCSYEKSGIMCLKCGRLGHFQELCSDPAAEIAMSDRFRCLLASPFNPRGNQSSQASSSNQEKGEFFRRQAIEMARNQPMFSPEWGTSSESALEKMGSGLSPAHGKSTTPLTSTYDPSKTSFSAGSKHVFGKDTVVNMNGTLINNIDGMGQLKPLSFGSPPRMRRSTDESLYGSDGLRRVPPPDVDGEYIRQSNGIYVFQANGPAAGPVRIFSRTARGPGPQWGRNKKCIEMVIVPKMDKSPAKENTCRLVELEGNENTRVVPAGEREEKTAETSGTAAKTNPPLATGEKRQVSTESLQPVLKRQRPDEF